MHRPLIYPYEQPRSTDFLFGMQQAMVGLGQLAQAVLGSSTLVTGLACEPTTPASLSVTVGAGQIYSQEPLEASQYGILPADTTDVIVKQGIMLQPQTLTFIAPTTAGYSINYLIEASYQDQDSDPVVLPYFNSANPSQPLSGQNNTGAPQPTERLGTLVLTAKAGAAATTGSQTTPAVDAGYIALYVVTVANGQTQITSGNIVTASGAPIVSNLLTMMQSASAITAHDTGTTNAYACALTPAPLALAPGMLVAIDAIVATNNGASTLNVSGLGALPIQSAGGLALQGGELVTGYGAVLRLNHAGTAWTLIQTTGGPLPVPAGAHSQHAVNLGQFASSLAASGYQKLPSGLILQWTSITITTANTLQTITPPLAWPTGALAAVGSCISTGSYGGAAVASGAVQGWANNAGAVLSVFMVGY